MKLKGVTPMGCGGCGGTIFRIYQNTIGELITECTQCDSQSHITVTEPKLEIKWGDHGEGILAGRPRDSTKNQEGEMMFTRKQILDAAASVYQLANG